MKMLILVLLIVPVVSFGQVNPDADFFSGIAKLEKKDFEGAISDFTKYILENPNIAATYVNRAIAKAKLGDLYGAIGDNTKAIEISPNYADAYYNRGDYKKELGDYKGAVADFTKVTEINPNDGDAFTKEDMLSYQN